MVYRSKLKTSDVYLKDSFPFSQDKYIPIILIISNIQTWSNMDLDFVFQWVTHVYARESSFDVI